MAELPFCPFSKLSSTSSTSVLCKCLISVANLSIDEAKIDIALKKAACLSLGIICVEIFSGFKFSFAT